MGRLLLKSLEKLDYPVLIAYVLVIGVMFAVLNMFVDWLYTVLDPRVRYE
jgi:peptide/nickel transport system permease protein